jgi:hypothetical protein
MDRKVVPFKRWHYDWIGISAEPRSVRPHESVLAQLEQENSWTGIVDGEVIFCAGTVAQWPTRHTTWALLQETLSRQHMLWVTKEVLKGLATVKGRIELTVRTDFPAGKQWARMLGFQVETPLLKMFGPEGEDHIGYVRMN